MNAPVDDIDRVMGVMERAFEPAWGEAWSRRQVEDAMLMGNCHLLLCAQDARPPAADEPAAGFALSRHGFEEEELLLLAVLPEHRHSGLGKYLLDQVKQTARERGAHRLLLEMRDGNPAERIYLAAGFAPIGRRTKYYRAASGDRIDAITFSCTF